MPRVTAATVHRLEIATAMPRITAVSVGSAEIAVASPAIVAMTSANGIGSADHDHIVAGRVL